MTLRIDTRLKLNAADNLAMMIYNLSLIKHDAFMELYDQFLRMHKDFEKYDDSPIDLNES